MSSDSTFSNQAAGASAAVQQASSWIEPLRTEIGRYLIGQTPMVDRLVVGLLGNGHVLLEGVPGLAKTLAVKTLAALVDAKFHRIQFTPECCPPTSSARMIYDPRDSATSG